MLKVLRDPKILSYALGIIALSIPYFYQYTAILLIIFYVLWALQANLKEFASNLRQRKVIWVWIAFYLLHVISYTYSLDKDYSAFDLERKVSLLLFPLVVGGGVKTDDKALTRIFTLFVAGVSLLAIFCLGRAIHIYQATHSFDHFFYHKLVAGFDPNAVYCALYSLFAIAILLFHPISSTELNYLRVPLLIIIVIFFILLSSRTLILAFFALVIPYYLIYSFRRRKKGALYVITLFLLYAALAVAIFKTDNPIRSRYAEIFKSSETTKWSDSNVAHSQNFNNLSLRLFLWRVAFNNVRDNDLWLKGGGNGSATILQNRKMTEYGIKDIYNPNNRSALYNINTHNMYVQTLLELGIPGLTLLLMAGFSFVAYLKHTKVKELSIVLNLTVLLLMFQESVLETQAGVVFYALFAMIIYSHTKTLQSRENIS